jgi:HAD superfamily hydrolase (TIGR01509 family)
MPGAAEAIARLGSHFPIAVATNSNRADTRFVLEHFGLVAEFAAVITREMYDRPKPEPDAFRTAAQRLGIPAPGCVVLEDAMKGVLAAHGAGCLCVAVPNEFTRDNDFSLATRVVESLDAVTPALIEELLAGRS